MAFTSDTLIADVKRRASIPTSQNLFTDADFLELANSEILIGILPSVMQLQEEHFVYEVDVTLVASVSKYKIPYRAVGGKLRDLFYKDTNGNLQEMTRISPDDRSYFQGTSGSNHYQAYYIQGEDIILTPGVGTTPSGSLVMTFYLRPNQLVAETRVGVISEITEGDTTTVFTLSSIPAVFYDSDFALATSKFDILQFKPAHRTKTFDILATEVDSTAKTVTFNNSDLPDGIEVGDHIALAGECIIPQIPTDLHPVLAQRVTARCLEAMGDQNGLQAANTKLAEMEVKTGTLIDSRVEGSTLKINNIRGLLRSGKARRRGWY